MKKKVLFIYNPRAGKGQIRQCLSEILEVFAEAEYEMTVCPTRAPREAAQLAQEKAKDYDMVLCSGGDGTLDEVVTGLIHGGVQVPLGYIPAGSTNDFAMSLGLPRDMVECAKVIVNENLYPCDLGMFNTGVFVYVAAFGMFTEVSYVTSQESKNRLGHMAYLLEGIRSLSTIRAYHMRVDVDGEIIEDDFLYGGITNALQVGGFHGLIGPDVSLNDGVFEVLLIKNPSNALELNEIINCLWTQEGDGKWVHLLKGKHVTLESAEPVAWTMDGENGGEHTRVEIQNMSLALNICVPEKREKETEDLDIWKEAMRQRGML